VARFLASNDANIGVQRILFMRTTLVLDDELLGMAEEYTGLSEKTAIVREAMKALIERESARRLARMGGIAPKLELAARRRSSGA
jgi:Arc/MetJ family transcription regulator